MRNSLVNYVMLLIKFWYLHWPSLIPVTYSWPGSETSQEAMELFPLVVNAIGVVGSSWETHHSGARSKDLACTSYNFDACFGKAKAEVQGRRTVDFTLRCFFDSGLRFGAVRQLQSGALIHVIGQLCGKFQGEELEQTSVLITDFDVIPSTSSTAPPTPMNTPPRPSRLRFGPAGTHGAPTTQAISASQTPHTRAVSPGRISIDNAEVADGAISDSEDSPRSSKRRRILSSKAESTE